MSQQTAGEVFRYGFAEPPEPIIRMPRHGHCQLVLYHKMKDL